MQVTSVSIEPMLLSDLDADKAIDRKCFPLPWQEPAYVTELSNRASCYLTLRVSCEIVGYGGLWVVAKEAHITTLAVDPVHQRKGLGDLILGSRLDEAILRGATFCTLEVREGNRA